MRLWKDNPSRRFVVLVVALAAGVLGYLLLHHILFALVGFGVIMGSTTDYWLPQKFKIDGNGASMRCGISVTAIQWSDVKRVVESPSGVLLSPLGEASSRLNAFRGLLLRYDENREAVLEAVRQNWKDDVRPVEI
ncbi:MAG TPA: hypothetical protein VEX38_10850 [Fimbriimonadaceae bacterium]|nr:hypothetical protein [Fimbriimonadaceae bacterium]